MWIVIGACFGYGAVLFFGNIGSLRFQDDAYKKDQLERELHRSCFAWIGASPRFVLLALAAGAAFQGLTYVLAYLVDAAKNSPTPHGALRSGLLWIDGVSRQSIWAWGLHNIVTAIPCC
jgi:hypothetical protein